MTATDAAAPPRAAAPTALFTATVGLSAALLFAIQPIYARMIMPALGGAPAVWTTAMLFFQCALMAGYAYAHMLARLAPRTQALMHAAVVAGAFAALPIAAPAGWRLDPSGSVSLQTLGLLAAGVGAPFFALAANAPLLQAWYGASAQGARDPYFLYGASNAGSAVALLGYPLVVEPAFGLTQAGVGWSVGYAALAGLLALCARTMLAGSTPAGTPPPRAATAAQTAAAPRAPSPSPGALARWAAIAFVPSSLMLAVTEIAAADLGAFPLIWIGPLGLYLVSFAAAFSPGRAPSSRAATPVALLASSLCLVLVLTPAGARPGAGISLTILFAGFAVIAYAMHRRLYEERPAPAALTAFYLALSAGGALGGAFNALVAPALFDDLTEGPLVLALCGAALARPEGAGALIRDAGRAALAAAALIAGLAAAAAAGLEGAALVAALAALSVVALGAPSWRPVAHAAVALVAVLAVKTQAGDGAVLRARSFFGVYSVEDRPGAGLREFSHGSTIHGSQRLEETAGRPTPVAYYHAAGPIGAVLRAAEDGARVGVVGLGVGAVACHARPGQSWSFFEIDPLVDRIARDPALFRFMQACAADAPTVLGDARLTLADRPPGAFDLLLIDAYSSDAVPIHLMTVEALDLYLSRLAPGGALLLHLSNRHLDLPRIAARGVSALGASALLCRRERGLAPGEHPSVAAVVARDAQTAARRARGDCWTPLADDGGRAWTDDAASLLDAL